MKPKRRIQLMILAAIVFGGLAWLFISDPDKPDYDETIRKQGTNAVPQLLDMFRSKDSKFKLKLIELSERQNLIKFHFHTASDSCDQAERGFEILGTNAGFAAPALIKIFEGRIPGGSRWAVSEALIDIGQSGTDAVFSFYDHQGKTNAEFRVWALSLLARANIEPKKLVPLLIQSLKDPVGDARTIAAHSLLDVVAEHRAEPAIRTAIPALTDALSDADIKVRDMAAHALKLLEPEATAIARVRQK